MIAVEYHRSPRTHLRGEETRKERTRGRRESEKSAGPDHGANESPGPGSLAGGKLKTARFKDLIARSGRPELHLTWTAPASDQRLQMAVKQRRLLTVYQQTRGSKKDYGVVGFASSSHAQYLIFPKSIGAFADRRIVGIQYDLLKDELSSGDKVPATRRRAKPTGRTAAKKVVPFRQPERTPSPLEQGISVDAPAALQFPGPEETDPFKREVRKAIADLRAGHTQKARKRLEALIER